MNTRTRTAHHAHTVHMDIHDIVRELNDALGPTLVSALVGSKDRKAPIRWAKPDGPVPRDESVRLLMFAHRQWNALADADGDHVARQWFIGGNPLLDEDTPITAIREGRHDEVSRAVQSFVEGSAGA